LNPLPECINKLKRKPKYMEGAHKPVQELKRKGAKILTLFFLSKYTCVLPCCPAGATSLVHMDRAMVQVHLCIGMFDEQFDI
jgi:hypothetical protein